MKYSRNEALLATGEKIREERKNRNLNQKQFSEMLVKNFAIKADRSKIAKWETGRLHIQDDELIVLAKCFNVTTDYLLGLSETKSTDPKVKEICEYTGLVESSIEFLSKLKAYKIGDSIDMPVNEKKELLGQVTCEYDQPSYIVNLLLNNPHIVGLFYSYMCLLNHNDCNYYQGDRGSAVLFELMLELRKLRDGFQSYYKEAYYQFYKKDGANNG